MHLPAGVLAWANNIIAAIKKQKMCVWNPMGKIIRFYKETSIDRDKTEN